MNNLTNDVIIHTTKGNLQYIQFKKLLEYDDIIKHCYTLKNLDFGFHYDVKKYMDTVMKNYELVCNEIGMDYRNILRPIQTHTNNVKNIEEKINKDCADICMDEYINIDGVITDKKNIILTTTNADCILMLFFDPIKRVIANVHSGWKGTFEKVAENIVKEMMIKYNSNPKDIICCMCPAIRECHFEVDEDVRELCEHKFIYTKMLDKIISKGRFFEGKQKYNINTHLINRIILQDLGLKEENIIDSEICTVCDNKYLHSKRGSNDCNWGLGTALIELS